MRRAVLGAALALTLPCLALSGCGDIKPAPATPDAAPPAPRDKGLIYVPNPKATGDQDPLMPRTVPLHRSPTPVRDAVAALLQDPHGPMPSGTALRGVTLQDGLATLDFSGPIIDENGSEGKQSDALGALARTLGQFPEVKQYQVMVQGKPVHSFGEAGEIDGPIDVVRPPAGNAP